MLRVGSVVLGAQDVARAAAFYRHALDYVDKYPPDETWALLTPADGGRPNISIALSETPLQDKPRIHLDLYAGDSADQVAEVERLIALGASHVDWEDYPPGPDFVVLADTEGNRFCVIDTGSTHG